MEFDEDGKQLNSVYSIKYFAEDFSTENISDKDLQAGWHDCAEITDPKEFADYSVVDLLATSIDEMEDC